MTYQQQYHIMLRLGLFILFFAPLCLFAQSKSKSTAVGSPQPSASEKIVKKLDAVSFLKEILGASYSKSDKSWVLPRSKDNTVLFGSDAEGGLFIAVDTIIKRNVGENQEQWVLFIVEGYIFNFASMVKTAGGWKVKDLKYSIHQGAPGEYQPLDFDFVMISQKTFVSIKEAWFDGGNIIGKWLLFDPFTQKQALSITTDTEPVGDELPDQYKYFTTDKTEYKPGKSILPDLVFTQVYREKLKGKKETKKELKLRYLWNEKKSVFEKEKVN